MTEKTFSCDGTELGNPLPKIFGPPSAPLSEQQTARFTFDYGDNRRLEFECPNHLSEYDLLTLRGLSALASVPENDALYTLQWKDVTNCDAWESISVSTTLSELAAARGKSCPSEKDCEQILDSIWRMFTAVAIVSEGTKRRPPRFLLENYWSDLNTGRLEVSLYRLFIIRPPHDISYR